MTDDPDLILVIATLVTLFSLSSTITGWVNGDRAYVAWLALAIGIGLLVFSHTLQPDGLTPRDFPDAFINITARVLRWF